jgi:hypothetical protein
MTRENTDDVAQKPDDIDGTSDDVDGRKTPAAASAAEAP